MKKLFGKEKDPLPRENPAPYPYKESPPPSATSSTLGTTTGETYTETVVNEDPIQPGVVYEKKTIVDEPLRHESVTGGMKETFRNPISAFKGQPRERSPNEVRRKEYIERETVPKKEYKTTRVEPPLGKPKMAKEIRAEYRKEPVVREYVVTEEPLYEVEAPVHVETRERGPIVKEHIHPKEIEEIQPVIHREREKTEYVEMTKPILERDILPTQFEERTLPAETRPTVYEGESDKFKQNYKLATERYKPSVEVSPLEREVVQKPPIIKERITKKVIEEIQPVIYREVTEPHIIMETKPIYEKVIEGPTLVEKGELPQEYLRTKERYSREYKERPKEREREYREYIIPKESFKESHKESHKEPRETSKEYLRESSKERSRGTSKEYLKTSKEYPREYVTREYVQEPREYVTREYVQEPREHVTRGYVQEPQYITREYVKEPPKEYSTMEYKEYVPRESVSASTPKESTTQEVTEESQVDQPSSEEYYKGEPEIRQYYNSQGKLVREYSFREGEYAKPLRLRKQSLSERRSKEIPITEIPEQTSSGDTETRG